MFSFASSPSASFSVALAFFALALAGLLRPGLAAELWFGVGGLRGAFATIEFQQELLIEPETLLPAFHLVPRFLGEFFVGAKIENKKGLGHAFSISVMLAAVKPAGA